MVAHTEVINDTDQRIQMLNDDIPVFGGDEFCGNIPVSRETLNKITKLLRIPEHRWNQIATGILEQDETKKTHLL